MRLWARVFLGYFLIVGLAGWFLLRVFVSEVKPGVRDAVEDVMVDTAQLLAELARDDLLRQQLAAGRFAQSVESYRQRPVKAAIWSIEKQTLDFQVYVTDAAGVVRFDSEGKALGKDYSNWRDVARTLRGEYGSRSTRGDPNDESTSVMHVAAAVWDGDRIVGVVTLAKPTRTLEPLIHRGEKAVLHQGLWLLGAALLIGIGFTAWLTLSFDRLVRYAKALSTGQHAVPPSTGRDEIGDLSRALAHLRDQVDGRAYVEDYVQNLTHEMKSPLAAIRGASELLAEPGMLEAQKIRFVDNITSQSIRLQELVDKVLWLARLEHQRGLATRQQVKVRELFAQVERTLIVQATRREVTLQFDVDDVLCVDGDRFLLGLAITSLVQNALDFSPNGGHVTCSAYRKVDCLRVNVCDEGPGFPDYARDRLFERFFSLPRPDGSPKSTGLGLALVKEITLLHDGSITLENLPERGLAARLVIKSQYFQ